MNKQQLANRIWAAANKMRSKIEASEYKDYILGFIFYKFLSEREVTFLKQEGAIEEDIIEFSEEGVEADNVRSNLGYVISYQNLYSTWLSTNDFTVARVRDALNAFERNIHPEYKKVFAKIFDTLLNGLSKLGENTSAQTKAIKDLLTLIKDIPMDNNQDYDVLGFIYEYLIGNFAANAGKKAGEFYTPHEVSVLMSDIIAYHLKEQKEIKIYDPCSGSGSLLLNIGQSVAKHLNNKNGIKYYAQELKENTYNLTRMNLVMKGILPANIITRCGDSLAMDWPLFDDNDPENTYEPILDLSAVCMNPPYSQQWDPQNKENDPRFKGYGVAPKSKADYAFLLHGFYHLKFGGIQTIVLPHGVLFRGNEEEVIRKNLIENNCIDTIIGLPSNIFFGTGIPTIVMVLKKGRKEEDVLFIDASKGFIKEGKDNKLRARDIRKIVDTYIARKDVPKFARAVSREEIRANEYNLNIPRYVDSSENTENMDLFSIMQGWLPKQEILTNCSELEVFNTLWNNLFIETDTPYTRLKTTDIKGTINKDSSVIAYEEKFRAAFNDLPQYLYKTLIENKEHLAIASTENEIADYLFKLFKDLPLSDKYEAYQSLDNYWKIISEDLESIQNEGIQTINQVDPNMVLKNKNGTQIEVQEGYKGHIIPFALVEDNFLRTQKEELKNILCREQDCENSLEELKEDFSEDEAEIYVNEKGFIKDAVEETLKEYTRKNSPLIADRGSLEEKLLNIRNLLLRQKELKKESKKLEAEIQCMAKEKVENLTKEEGDLLLREKWIVPFVSEITEANRRIKENLAQKIEAIAKKYQYTFEDTDSEIRKTERGLVELLSSLEGNEFDMQGISDLKKILGE